MGTCAGNVAVERALRICGAVCRSLAAACVGVIHRDVKPENHLCDWLSEEEAVKVCGVWDCDGGRTQRRTSGNTDGGRVGRGDAGLHCAGACCGKRVRRADGYAVGVSSTMSVSQCCSHKRTRWNNARNNVDLTQRW